MMKALARLGSDDRGAVAPTVALSLIGLIAVGGLAFDYAHMATLDTELQTAADQAALAAASQLDGEDGACQRAVDAARGLVGNPTRMANDGNGLAVTIAASPVCTSDTVITDDAGASVRFFQDKLATIPATTMAEARFVVVKVVTRGANYALTPIVGALNSGDLGASAMAGMGTALCKVPPLMICPPSGTIDWTTMRGKGIKAVSNSGSNWAPGNFGYIGPQDANSTQKGLAFENPVFQCQEIEGSEPVSTGSPTPAITAINTRFDVYDISNGGGNVLSPCTGTACPPALNVTKDLVNVNAPTGNNACKQGNNGWRLPLRRFWPRAKQATDTATTALQDPTKGTITAMGLPRDNCHYTSYNSSCGGTNSRFGDGNWARRDYFDKYHPSVRPTDWSSMTRYETYLWEIANSQIPNQVSSGSGANTLYQKGTPVCNATVPDSTRDRRVLQVAIGGNCSALHGGSTPVTVTGWLEVFLVEPGTSGTNARGNGDSGNEIYLEVIGPVTPGGASAQVIRRDLPYLVR